MGEARPEKMKQAHHPTRPEGAEAPSPGHSPWVNQQSTLRPVRAKALKITPTTNILTLKKIINRKRNRERGRKT